MAKYNYLYSAKIVYLLYLCIYYNNSVYATHRKKRRTKTFKHMMQSTESKLVAVYGRRRIGKTFLIRKYFDTKFTFEIVGLHNGNMKDQIRHFVQTLVRHGYAEAMVAHPYTWMETFDLFSLYLNKLKGKEKK